jgi:soluble lytic murein transglycosylase-like protein
MLRKMLFLMMFILYSDTLFAQQKNCITLAARCFNINQLLINAIIWQESGNNQQAISKNKNRTQDVGLMQINSIHFKKFKTMGVSESDLRNNSCANVFAGTWILQQLTQRYGYSWDSIGRYHSSTPGYKLSYIKKIVNIIAYRKDISEFHVPESDIANKFTCVGKR